MTNHTFINAAALRGTAKALRAIKGDIILCGGNFNGKTWRDLVKHDGVIGGADFSVAVNRKVLIDTLSACVPIKLGMVITWTDDKATITCGDFVAKLPAQVVAEADDDVSCAYIDTVEYSNSLGALAQFAKKSKQFKFILVCGGAAYATDGFILVRVEYKSDAVDDVEYYVAPDALIGHKEGNGVALYGAETNDETVTRSVNTSSGVTKVSRVKIGHRPRVHEAVSALLQDKNPKYRIGFDVKELVKAHALVCAGAAITKGDKKTLIVLDHDKDAGTLSLRPYQPDVACDNALAELTKITFDVDCPDFDVSSNCVVYTTAGVLQDICRLIGTKTYVEMTAYEDMMVFERCHTFIVAMGCNPDYA